MSLTHKRYYNKNTYYHQYAKTCKRNYVAKRYLILKMCSFLSYLTTCKIRVLKMNEKSNYVRTIYINNIFIFSMK